MKTLDLNHDVVGNQVELVVLDGLLNADTSPKLEKKLHLLSEDNSPKILVDMEKLPYISSAGIGCFIGVIKKIRDKNGDIRFSNLGPRVKRVFDLLDMSEFFMFFENREDGIASFN
ncbi:MAG: anti-sigma B factor antagonist [bacterium]|jgi:anti-sigma B factor antagonist